MNARTLVTTTLVLLTISTALAPAATANRPLIYNCYPDASQPCWDEKDDGWYLCQGSRCVGPANTAHGLYQKIPRSIEYEVTGLVLFAEDALRQLLPLP